MAGGIEPTTSAQGLQTRQRFRVGEGFAYPTLSLPEDAPTFEVIGSFVYAAAGGTAWFESRNPTAKQNVGRGQRERDRTKAARCDPWAAPLPAAKEVTPNV
jgi:hypothetical protein